MTTSRIRDYILRTPAKSGVGIETPDIQPRQTHAASVFFIVVCTRTSELAWDVFEKLEDCYFSQKIPEQLQLPESTLSINYPLSWFSEHHPYSMMSYVDRKTLNLDVSVLFDMPSPTMRILNELHSKGYNVDAAVAEFNAFKHLTEEMRRTLQDISRLSDRNSRKGFTLSL
ncbi:antitermination protein [Escherichia coli]|nr:antitermination protein [Escherichia coli]MCF3238301.1 antitermination protein [Escherichia coli]MCN3319545.1 antitermination protein [Escherichia coli]MCN8220121.1 antitermination protein [Escherichia coli]MDA6307235.1 antitermination protein [Escherichia coli]